MSEIPDRDRVVESARAGVAAAAPEELAFFSATAASYLRRPKRTLAGRRPRDEALGSGTAAVVTLVSPVALAVATAVYQQLTQRTADAVTNASVGLGHRLWRGLLRRLRRRSTDRGPGSAAEPPVPPAAALTFSDLQRSEVRSVAEARARALGLSEEKVTLLVGAIMDSLDRH